MPPPATAIQAIEFDTRLPDGVRLIPLRMNADARGCFTEVFRREWSTGVDPVQWNLVRSEAGVLRGVHVHRRHGDYLIVVEGEAVVGLKDLRPAARANGRSACVALRADRLQAIVIPPGVAHGFYFTAPSMHLYSVTHYWDGSDELGCRWDDPDLGIRFPCQAPALSARDAGLPPLGELLHHLDGQ